MLQASYGSKVNGKDVVTDISTNASILLLHLETDYF